MEESTPLRIVAADDDARMREFYRAVLQQLGYAVVGVAADGYSLVELSLRAEDAIDLIVTDIRMPQMSGIHAACIVAERRESPFLFVSAFRDELRQLQIDLPFAYDYLIKPVSPKDLATAIPHAASRSRHR